MLRRTLYFEIVPILFLFTQLFSHLTVNYHVSKHSDIPDNKDGYGIESFVLYYPKTFYYGKQVFRNTIGLEYQLKKQFKLPYDYNELLLL